jgi:hypothetical protein
MTLDTPRALAPTERLRWLEDPGPDFPFYNGAPVGLSGGQWLFVMAAVVAGFAVLVAPIPWPAAPAGRLDSGRAVPADSADGAGAGRAGSLDSHLR